MCALGEEKNAMLTPTMNDCFPATQFSRTIVPEGFCNGSAALLSGYCILARLSATPDDVWSVDSSQSKVFHFLYIEVTNRD